MGSMFGKYISWGRRNITEKGLNSSSTKLLPQNSIVYSSRATGTTFKEISGGEFALTVIPLPPLEEQKRMVAKIDIIMSYIDKLEDSINNQNYISGIVQAKAIELEKELINN